MTVNPYQIIRHPWVTEKTMNRMDEESKIDFVVDIDANKTTIKWAVEELFETTVTKVNTRITMEGKKIASIGFSSPEEAEDIAMRVGIF